MAETTRPKPEAQHSARKTTQPPHHGLRGTIGSGPHCSQAAPALGPASGDTTEKTTRPGARPGHVRVPPSPRPAAARHSHGHPGCLCDSAPTDDGTARTTSARVLVGTCQRLSAGPQGTARLTPQGPRAPQRRPVTLTPPLQPLPDGGQPHCAR